MSAVYLFCCGALYVDLSLGSGDGYTVGKDFDWTHQVDHLAQLGTSPSVSTKFITFSFFLIFFLLLPMLLLIQANSDVASALINFSCETLELQLKAFFHSEHF